MTGVVGSVDPRGGRLDGAFLRRIRIEHSEDPLQDARRLHIQRDADMLQRHLFRVSLHPPATRPRFHTLWICVW